MSGPSKKSALRVSVAVALSLLAGPCLRAQSPGDSPARTASAAPSPATASLEERIATARSVKVITSILGIELGSELDEAHEKLDPLCAPGTRPKEEGEKDADQRGKQAAGEHQPKIGEESEEGRKVLWQLAGTDYSAIYITADDKERIDSITGFLRPEKAMSFEAVGEVSKAPVRDNDSVIWDVLRVGRPLFRVVAKGGGGKVNTIRIFIVRRKSGEPVPYTGEADSKSQ